MGLPKKMPYPITILSTSHKILIVPKEDRLCNHDSLDWRVLLQTNTPQRTDQDTYNIYGESDLEVEITTERTAYHESHKHNQWVKEDKSKKINRLPTPKVLDVDTVWESKDS